MGTFSYIQLYYIHNIKFVSQISKCQRDPDYPSLSPSVQSSVNSLEPRKEKNCPDQRLSSVFGPTSKKRSCRILTTSSSSHRTPRCSPSLARRKSVPSAWRSTRKHISHQLKQLHLIFDTGLGPESLN